MASFQIVLTKRLKDSLNFWKMSMNSASGGGFALIVSIPSPISFLFDLRFLEKCLVRNHKADSKTNNGNIALLNL